MNILVNGEEITNAEIEEVRRQLEMQQLDGDGLSLDNGREADPETFAKDMVIARVLVKQEAQKNGPEIPREDIEAEFKKLVEEQGGQEKFDEAIKEAGLTPEDFERDIELRLKVDRMLDGICEDLPDPTDEEVKKCYEENKAAFRIPERAHAAHIVKHVQGNLIDMHAAHEELSGVLKTIQEGGTTFEEMAGRYSDCPDDKGDLGWFARGAMVPEFEKVVFNLEKGEVSGVFQSPFGLHIAKLYDKMPAQDRGFDEVREDVKEAVARAKENSVIDAFTDKLRAQAEIKEVEEEQNKK